MADSRGAKQPRQSDFDRSSFTQSPPKLPSEPTKPIDLLIPNRIAEEKAAKAAQTELPKPMKQVEEPNPTVTPPPCPSHRTCRTPGAAQGEDFRDAPCRDG